MAARTDFPWNPFPPLLPHPFLLDCEVASPQHICPDLRWPHGNPSFPAHSPSRTDPGGKQVKSQSHW